MIVQFIQSEAKKVERLQKEMDKPSLTLRYHNLLVIAYIHSFVDRGCWAIGLP